jgi:ATP-dependent DNA ligase
VRTEPGAIFAFDLLELRGKDLRALLLLKRKAPLERLLRKSTRFR